MILRLFCLIFAIYTVSISKIIQKVQKKSIQIQLGQQYLEIIPQKFNNFQHSSLVSLKRHTEYYQKPICQIRQYKQGELKHINTLLYKQFNNFSSQNHKIIYKLAELKSLKIFIDAIKINIDRVISIYSNNEIIVYRIQQNGMLYYEKEFKILQKQLLTDGKFVIIYQQPYFLNKNIMFRVNASSGSITIIDGYEELSQMFDDFEFIDDHIYLAGGNDGLVHYVIDHTLNRLRGYGRMKFQLKSQQAYGLFDVNQIHIENGESNSKKLYILDYNEGLIETTIPAWPQLKPNQNITTITINTSLALIGGCQNLIVTSFHIYLTCPELIQLNKFNHRVEKSNHLSFSPNRLEFDSKRLYAFGNRQFAVYDIYGSSSAQYSFNSVVEKSIIIGLYLLSFSNKQVISALIQPYKEAFYCYTLDSTRAGTYEGYFQTQGLCTEQKTKVSTKDQICYVQYPFSLQIKSIKQPNYMIYLIIIVAFFSFSGITALITLIRYHLMNKKYKKLVQEEQKNEGPSNLQLYQRNKKNQQALSQQ